MKSQQIKKTIQFILFLVVGAVILWWLYRDQDADELLRAIKEDVNYFWILASLMAGLLSHISRTIRWQMMITPLSKRPSFINTFLAVMIGYLANLAIPRMGEVSRCAVLSKHENISFTRLVGTVVAERALDVVSLLLSLFLVFVFQFEVIMSLFARHVDFSGVVNSFATPVPYVIIALLWAVVWLFRKRIRTTRVFYKAKGLWEKFKEGFLSFRDVKQKGWFIFHSVMIFVLYFLMMYLSFFAFSYTAHLLPVAALTVFVFGTLGMLAPVQGGIGPWHFMVITSLAAYQIPAAEGGIFALVVHGALNLMIVLFGLLSLLLLPFVNKRS
ncbi:lysylphosphatidylglycerol synthase transmembrane domain-containing protein [Alkaliflexus imshenetskii]|uniref:lysylphosphatidylglycerol synthase transmembrane domain-containing protein n=1 Tax=Alkaliflexus imshenetskii TaxID=286730 RepID=UPI0004B84D07|nr:lysylphosphatidylglycerol synthase transmembrane domain-containing protein [Alkaliflexus imshenetskii]